MSYRVRHLSYGLLFVFAGAQLTLAEDLAKDLDGVLDAILRSLTRLRAAGHGSNRQ